MLGLRLDEPLGLDRLDGVVARASLARLVDGRLVEATAAGIRLTPRGRLVGDAVTAELLA